MAFFFVHMQQSTEKNKGVSLCKKRFDYFDFLQDQIPEQVVKKVEFGLLLYLACQNAPQNVIQVRYRELTL